jgi:hypothetical protein
LSIQFILSSIPKPEIPGPAGVLDSDTASEKENGDAACAASPPPSPYALAGELLHPLINFLPSNGSVPTIDQTANNDRVIIPPVNAAGNTVESKNEANQRQNATQRSDRFKTSLIQTPQEQNRADLRIPVAGL